MEMLLYYWSQLQFSKKSKWFYDNVTLTYCATYTVYLKALISWLPTRIQGP